MKNKIILIFAVLLLASVSHGQKTLSAKGYFCGQTEPSYVNVHLVVGSSVKISLLAPTTPCRFAEPRIKLFFNCRLEQS